MKDSNIITNSNAFIEKATVFIEQNIYDECNIDRFAQEMFMSKSKLYRIFLKITGTTPLEFIKNFKLKKALHLFRNEELSIKEIAYSCGFNDPKYFSRCFKKEFGVTPREYRSGMHHRASYLWGGFNLN